MHITYAQANCLRFKSATVQSDCKFITIYLRMDMFYSYFGFFIFIEYFLLAGGWREIMFFVFRSLNCIVILHVTSDRLLIEHTL